MSKDQAHLAAEGRSLADQDNRWLSGGELVLLAEAGKKKKKEKSEVVVISVNNAQPKGYGGGGGMYPIFVPSCGGGHAGYGRKRRR